MDLLDFWARPDFSLGKPFSSAEGRADSVANHEGE